MEIETRIAILIYLPEEISSLIQEVKVKTGVYYPNYETSAPHLTLYSCKFEESKFPLLVEELGKLRFKPFVVKIKGLSIIPQNKNSRLFASLEFVDVSLIHALHEAVLSIGNSLRGDLIRLKDVNRFKEGIFTKEEFERIQKYGYEYVKENYFPHITIGEVEVGDSKTINLLQTELGELEGREIKVDRFQVRLSYRSVPDEKKVKESESVEVLLDK